MLGTPGRVIDLLKRGALNLSEIQFVVLDEADQMLNVGFAEDVEVIMEKLPKKRQNLMFSATMPKWIQKITRQYLQDPVVIDLVSCYFIFLFILQDVSSVPFIDCHHMEKEMSERDNHGTWWIWNLILILYATWK